MSKRKTFKELFPSGIAFAVSLTSEQVAYINEAVTNHDSNVETIDQLNSFIEFADKRINEAVA